MKFEENLRELRKQKGYSQEELAQRLDVSRQAVSKWENGSGYPELDKLMKLCDLFQCTMDDLLKGDVSEKNVVGVERYEKHHEQMARVMTFGVFMVMSAVTSGAFLDGMFVGDQEVIIGLVFFIFITIGVLTFVYFGMQKDTFEKKYPEIPQDIYTQEELDGFEKRHRFSTVLGIGLIFMDLITAMLLEHLVSERIVGGVFMFLMSIAVAIFVYSGMQQSKYEKTCGTEYTEKKQHEAMMDKWYGVIMIFATIIFFIWGFAFKGWEYSWLSFVIGGLCCGIVSIVFSKTK